jgi:hypothetical protein
MERPEGGQQSLHIAAEKRMIRGVELSGAYS